MMRRLNAAQKRELAEHNKKFMAENPDYYKVDDNANEYYEADFTAEIAAAKAGKRVYAEMNY